MLLYLTENNLSDTASQWLSHVEPGTHLLLTQNAVYLYETLSAKYPLHAIILLQEDAAIRGIASGDKTSWTMAEWVSLGTAFTPWIKI